MLREREKTRPAVRRSPAAARERRSALACAGCSLLLACVWASLWWNALVYPITVEQAAGWRARSPAAAAALRAAPRSARSVELVVSRFSGNLSWVPALAAQMRVTNITVYCKNPDAPAPTVPCTHSLPNVGNEGHTYLWHVTRRWDELPDLLLLLPDTVEYGDKLKTWRRLQRRLEAHGPTIYYADDFSPITGFRFAINWLNERFYGVNFPCVDHRRGGTECTYFGHTDGVNPSGRLVPAQPADWLEWLDAHVEGTRRHQVARCGWGNRGMVVVSRAAVRGHSRAFYQNILEQLSRDVFPMAGMFMERLWRRVWLCSNMEPGGEGRGTP